MKNTDPLMAEFQADFKPVEKVFKKMRKRKIKSHTSLTKKVHISVMFLLKTFRAFLKISVKLSSFLIPILNFLIKTCNLL
jgi:hypothetical protein